MTTPGNFWANVYSNNTRFAVTQSALAIGETGPSELLSTRSLTICLPTKKWCVGSRVPHPLLHEDLDFLDRSGRLWRDIELAMEGREFINFCRISAISKACFVLTGPN